MHRMQHCRFYFPPFSHVGYIAAHPKSPAVTAPWFRERGCATSSRLDSKRLDPRYTNIISTPTCTYIIPQILQRTTSPATTAHAAQDPEVVRSESVHHIPSSTSAAFGAELKNRQHLPAQTATPGATHSDGRVRNAPAASSAALARCSFTASMCNRSPRPAAVCPVLPLLAP